MRGTRTRLPAIVFGACLIWIGLPVAPDAANVAVDCATQPLQTAIDAAAPGATIDVLPGICDPVTIAEDLTIVGVAGETIIDGGGDAFNVVRIDGPATVVLDGLTVRRGENGIRIGDRADVTLTRSTVTGNGAQNGDPDWDGGQGGISNAGDLTVTASVISDNWESSHGGGIDNDGTLVVVDSIIRDNHVWDAGGSGGGGGIANFGTAFVTDTEIMRNDAEEDSGGNVLNAGTMTIESSTISHGFAQESGGIENWADLTLRDVEISHNGGTDVGAIANSDWLAWEGVTPTLFAERVSIVDNGVVDFPNYDGISTIGAVENWAGTMVFHETSIERNVGACIGGVAARDAVSVIDSRIAGNASTGTGFCSEWTGKGGAFAVISGDVVVERTEISDNGSSTDGGGFLVEAGGTLRVENSTIAGNTAAWAGGGIRNLGGDVVVVASTIADNAAGSFGGGTSGEIDLLSSVVADNDAPTGPDCRGRVESSGWNVIGDATGCNLRWAASDLRNRDPKLRPLAENGGFGRTMKLRRASPAIDLVPPSECVVATDQRGVARPQGFSCDAGAFEAKRPAPACTITGTKGDDVLLGTAGDDVICGLRGNDDIRGRGGNDILVGGPGKDTIRGGPGDDTLDGGEHGDRLYGNAGDDTLLGRSGSDKLQGGPGADVLDGGTERDKLYGNAGGDTLIAGTGDGNRLSGAAGADAVIGGADADKLYGGDQPDWLEGHAGDDVLRGGTGNDTLDGGDGDDSLCGQAGDDIVIPSPGTDVICPWD